MEEWNDEGMNPVTISGCRAVAVKRLSPIDKAH